MKNDNQIVSPKVTPGEVAKLTDAAQEAYGHPEVDKFMDDVISSADRYSAAIRAEGEHTRTE